MLLRQWSQSSLTLLPLITLDAVLKATYVLQQQCTLGKTVLGGHAHFP